MIFEVGIPVDDAREPPPGDREPYRVHDREGGRRITGIQIEVER